MLDIKSKNIQVCVSPGEDCDASLGFAIAEARRRGCGIHLTLVLRPIWVGPSEVTDLKMIDGEWRKYGTDFLMECEYPGRSRAPSSTTRPAPSWWWTHVGSADRHICRGEHDE